MYEFKNKYSSKNFSISNRHELNQFDFKGIIKIIKFWIGLDVKFVN